MKKPFYSFLAAGLFLAGCGQDSSKQGQGTNATSSPLNAPADYVGALGRGQASAIKTVDIASLNQAVQMFNVNEGRFPKDLNELVDAKLIAKIPAAPNGMKLDYDPATGKVRVIPQ